MRSKLRRGYAAVAVLAIAFALLIVSMTAPVVSTTADFSIFNSGWNGTSDLAVLTYRTGKFVPTFETQSSGTEITIAQIGLDRLDLNPLTSSLVIIGPTKTFTSAEGKLVGDFVREGGKLLLADDFGTGNSLLEKMGATSRFSNDLVMDLAFEKQPEFTVIFDITPDPVTTNVTTVLLNYPTSLSINASGTEVLARSSIASWLDTNGDRLQEWGEPRGPFPVLARENLGSGVIVLLSDPSVLINGMSAYMDNEVLGTNLVDFVGQGRTSVMFDESHRKFFDPIAVTMVFTGTISTNAKIAIASVALILTLWIATDLVDRTLGWLVSTFRSLTRSFIKLIGLGRFLRREKPKPVPVSDEELMRRIQKEHPEWRPGLVRYLVRERARHSRHLEQK
jgi:hypothetical protein